MREISGRPFFPVDVAGVNDQVIRMALFFLESTIGTSIMKTNYFM